MTTKFGSFDASPLVALEESPLGARNRPPEEPEPAREIWLSLYWIDESVGPASYALLPEFDPTEFIAPDIMAWNNRVDELADQGVKLMVLVYHVRSRDGLYNPILPSVTAALIKNSRIREIERNAQLPLWTDLYEDFVVFPERITKVLATFDLSSSMADYWFAIRVAWNAFVTQLATKFADVRPLANTDVDAERWLGNSIQ